MLDFANCPIRELRHQAAQFITSAHPDDLYDIALEAVADRGLNLRGWSVSNGGPDAWVVSCNERPEPVATFARLEDAKRYIRDAQSLDTQALKVRVAGRPERLTCLAETRS